MQHYYFICCYSPRHGGAGQINPIEPTLSENSGQSVEIAEPRGGQYHSFTHSLPHLLTCHFFPLNWSSIHPHILIHSHSLPLCSKVVWIFYSFLGDFIRLRSACLPCLPACPTTVYLVQTLISITMMERVGRLLLPAQYMYNAEMPGSGSVSNSYLSIRFPADLLLKVRKISEILTGNARQLLNGTKVAVAAS